MSASAPLRSNTGETELRLKSAAAVMALVLSLGCSPEPEAEAAPSTPSTEMTESDPLFADKLRQKSNFSDQQL